MKAEEKQKLVWIEWDADDDSYLLFLQSAGSEDAVARLYTAELDALRAEIERVTAEMSA